MTAYEQALFRDVVCRLRRVERENRYLRASQRAAWTRWRKAKDDAMFLHGCLLAAGARVLEDGSGPGPRGLLPPGPSSSTRHSAGTAQPRARINQMAHGRSHPVGASAAVGTGGRV